jgi:DNA polymerase-3 subunit gamma/tau
VRHQLQGKQEPATLRRACAHENGSRGPRAQPEAEWCCLRGCSAKKKISLASDAPEGKPADIVTPPPPEKEFSAPPPAEEQKQAPAIARPELPPTESTKTKSAPKTIKLTDLLKGEKKTDEKQSVAAPEKIQNEPFTEEQLRTTWTAFAEQRRKLQAEFQMLSQPYALRDKQVVVTLLSPVHETMLNNIKVELTAFLREKLRNSSIQVTGELTSADEKKVIYTNREKFDYLADKNPILKELKDRLGLDTDF